MTAARIPPIVKASAPLMVALGMGDEEIVDFFRDELGDDAGPRRLAGWRWRVGLPNGRGWPVDDATLRRLLEEEGLTDGEIAARYGVGRRTVEVRRLEALGLRREHDSRPQARRRVVAMTSPRGTDPAPIAAASKTLGPRAGIDRDGVWWLDGRRVSVMEVLRAGGQAP